MSILNSKLCIQYSNMKIGIDASRAFIEEKTGIEEYSYQLIRSLTMMDVSSHQVFLYVRKNLSTNSIDFNLPDNFSVREIENNLLWTQIGLSLKIKKEAVDVLFVPSYTVPTVHPKKTVVTVHGLEFKHFPKCYSLKERIVLELNTLLSIRWSSKIIAPSENTKKDLIKFYKVSPEKIKVIYHGTGNQKSIKSKVHKVKSNEFDILFVGRLEKRKNLVNLIKAFEIFRKCYALRVAHYTLTLAGKEGFEFEEIKKAIEESPYRKDIVLKGYVSEREKGELYRNADVFVLPSFYEGFGLPILEAMSYGVPVVCSNISSLPEVAGNAALLVNPYNPDEIAAAMNKIFNGGDLKEKMIKKGFENVKRFNWEKCARETLDTLLNC
jgi:glycosyltransferase involved in cell wall biosynthesis